MIQNSGGQVVQTGLKQNQLFHSKPVQQDGNRVLNLHGN